MQSSLRRPLELSMGMSDDYLQAVSVFVQFLTYNYQSFHCHRYQLVVPMLELVLLYLDQDKHEISNGLRTYIAAFCCSLLCYFVYHSCFSSCCIELSCSKHCSVVVYHSSCMEYTCSSYKLQTLVQFYHNNYIHATMRNVVTCGMRILVV